MAIAVTALGPRHGLCPQPPETALSGAAPSCLVAVPLASAGLAPGAGVLTAQQVGRSDRDAARRSEDIDGILQAARFAYHEAVSRAAARHAIDPQLVLAIIASESRGDPSAVSRAGAIGLMQLMPATARALGVDPWNPIENIDGAVRYLAALLTTFRSVEMSLVAYNAGPTFAARYRNGGAELDTETRAFLARIRHLLRRSAPRP